VSARRRALPPSLPPPARPWTRRRGTDTLSPGAAQVREEGLLSLYRGLGPSMLLVSHGSIQFLTYEHAKQWLLAGQIPHAALEESARVQRRFSDGLGGGGGGREGPQLGASDLLVASTIAKVAAILGTYPCAEIRSRSARDPLEPSSGSAAAGGMTLDLLRTPLPLARPRRYQVVRSCMQQRAKVGSNTVGYSSTGDTVRHIWRADGGGGFYRGILPHILRSTPQATLTLMIYEYAQRALDAEGGGAPRRG